MTRILIVLFLLLPGMVFAQYAITGKVVNRDDAQPLANVNVFLNNATIGDKTAADGTFKFQVKPGTYQLIVSMVGFNTYELLILVNDADIKLPNIYLDKKVNVLTEVKITAKEDPDRDTYLEMFKKAFLGTTENAEQCKLVNPEMLDLNFDKKTHVLTAKSEDMLIVENQALGYRIKYQLTDFLYDQAGNRFMYGGSVFFEELKGNKSQQEQWDKKRLEIYKNSKLHFLRATVGNNLKGEGFTVFRLKPNMVRPPDSLINKNITIFTALKNEPHLRDSLSYWVEKSKLPKFNLEQSPQVVTEDDMIRSTGQKNIYAFGRSNDALYVVYDEGKPFKFTKRSLGELSDQNNKGATLINLSSAGTLLDGRGVIINPQSLSFAGVWANQRIAELLPDNYEPPETEQINQALYARLDSTLNNYSAAHAVEKVYLQFDKPFYAAGDTAYFKAYITNALYQPTALSKMLNVELIDAGKHISQSITLKIANGMAAGDLTLSDTLKSGNFRVRAYTALMRADGAGYFFEKNMSVVAKDADSRKSGSNTGAAAKAKQLVLAKGPSPGKIDVQFFPEGGNLLGGTPSKIAFKAITSNGLGIGASGVVIDEQGRRITEFRSQHLGMGVISFTPISGVAYKAQLTFADSSKATFYLPKAVDSGFGLSVTNPDPRHLTISVAATWHNSQPVINIVGQSGGKDYYFTTGKLVNGKYSATINKDIFPNGIVQFTVFTATGEPMNERLVFVRNPTDIKLKVSGADSISCARQKMNIKVLAASGDHKPVMGAFSVAVVAETQVPMIERNPETILSKLLLTSDLRGHVEQPGYYFSSADDKVNADLDLLMLTQGYHRFEWKEVLNDKASPQPSQPEKISMVSGTINGPDDKPMPNAKISMFSVSKAFFSSDTVADASGHFVFAGFPTDSMRYVLQATDKSLRNKTVIHIDRKPPPKIGENIVLADTGTRSYAPLISYYKFNKQFQEQQIKRGFGKHTIVLNEVVIKEKTQRKKWLANSANLNGAGNANDVITADQIPLGCVSIVAAISGRLHGIQFYGGTPYLGGLVGHMETSVFIDGIEVRSPVMFKSDYNPLNPGTTGSAGMTKAEQIDLLDPNSIASIEIITDASLSGVYGVRGGGGAILITTKKWNDMILDAKNMKISFGNYYPPTFYKARAFYSPKYDLETSSSPTLDLRTTIYWNPNVATDASGNATLEFFNSDTRGTYLVTIEGFDGNGHLGRQTYRYRVE